MTARRTDLLAITRWITGFVQRHPAQLPQHLALELGISLRGAQRLVRELVAAQWLVGEGNARQRVYRPGLLRQAVHSYPLAGLQQAPLWRRDFAPLLVLAPNVARLVQHAFSELLDNAVEHSGGTQVVVSLRQTPSHVQLLVSDDGCGVFDHVGRATGTDDAALAAFELSKGKLTSAPQSHTGRGLYFTARVADVFELHANAAVFRHRSDGGSRPLADAPLRRGSSVFVGISVDSTRSIDSVLRAHSSDASYAFDRTVLPLRMLSSAVGGLESRAQARRAVERLELFREVALDFAGLDDVGHGFADELLRVWPQRCPEVALSLCNMAPRVGALVGSVQSGRA